jgi:hypothetical protein
MVHIRRPYCNNGPLTNLLWLFKLYFSSYFLYLPSEEEDASGKRNIINDTGPGTWLCIASNQLQGNLYPSFCDVISHKMGSNNYT